jgi:hypothetical protein
MTQIKRERTGSTMRTRQIMGLTLALSSQALVSCKDGGDPPVLDDMAAARDAGGGHPARDGSAHLQRVFITSQKYLGSLMGGGGVAGADAACAAAAASAQLGGSFKAWVSTSSVNAIDRIADVGPWYDLAGTKIFTNRAGLMTTPMAAIWLDEHGQFLASDKIWTGTGYGGNFDSTDGACNDWTSAEMAQTAKVGQVGRQDGAAWTAFTGTTCDQQAHVLCFQQ